MNFRTTVNCEYNLDNNLTRVRSYNILDKVPAELYKEVLDWSEDKLDFSKMTISISDSASNKTLIVYKRPAVVLDGLGMCEIELRGGIVDICVEGTRTITVCTEVLPVLHYSNGISSMSMILSKTDEEVLSVFKDIVFPNLQQSFENIQVNDYQNKSINMVMTRFITSKKDLYSFLDEDTYNIITTPLDF